MARAFGSFVDCVLDGVLSAAGAYGSAALPDVFAAIASRSAMHYANDGTTQLSTAHATWQRQTRRVLYTSKYVRVEEGRFVVLPDYTAEVYYMANRNNDEKSIKQESQEETLGSFHTLQSDVLNVFMSFSTHSSSNRTGLHTNPITNLTEAPPAAPHVDDYADMFSEQ